MSRPEPCLALTICPALASFATLRGPDSQQPESRERNLKTELRRKHGCHCLPVTVLIKTHQQLEVHSSDIFTAVLSLTCFRCFLRGHLLSETFPGEPN